MEHNVKDYMMRTLNSFSPDDLIEDVIQVMYKRQFPIFPVVDQENVFLGTIYAGTLLKNIVPEQFGFLESHRLLYGVNQAAKNLQSIKRKRVKDYMSTHVIVVKESDRMNHLAEIMLKNKEAYLFVVNDERKLRGYILRSDLLYYLLGVGEENQ